jgi:ankyrin repeat protein
MREPTTVGVLICRHVSIDCVKTYYYRSAAVATGSTSPRTDSDIHVKDQYRLAVLHGAVGTLGSGAAGGRRRSGHPRVIMVAIHGSDRETALHGAASRGHAAVVRLVVDGGADIHEKDQYDGWTALHRAAWGGQLLVERSG